MHTPHRSRFRLSTACRAVLGAGLPAGAGSSATAATSAQEAAADAKADMWAGSRPRTARAPPVRRLVPLDGYDFFGAWDAACTTARTRRRPYAGTPKADRHASATMAELKGLGVPASKPLLGIGCHGRGRTGVTGSAPGGGRRGRWPAPPAPSAAATGGVTTPRRPSAPR